MLTVLTIAVVLAVVLVASAVLVVPREQAVVLERSGRFLRVAPSGVTIRLPGVDRVRARVFMGERVANFPPLRVATADGQLALIDVAIQYEVTDPRAVSYQVDDHAAALERLLGDTLDRELAGLPVADALASARSLPRRVREALADGAAQWGVAVTDVQIPDVQELDARTADIPNNDPDWRPDDEDRI